MTAPYASTGTILIGGDEMNTATTSIAGSAPLAELRAHVIESGTLVGEGGSMYLACSGTSRTDPAAVL